MAKQHDKEQERKQVFVYEELWVETDFQLVQ
jgi:hypothetical protein